MRTKNRVDLQKKIQAIGSSVLFFCVASQASTIILWMITRGNERSGNISRSLSYIIGLIFWLRWNRLVGS